MRNNRLLLICTASWFVCLGLLVIVPRLYVFDFLNGMGAAVGLVVLWRYTPGAVVAVGKILLGEALLRGHFLIVGIWFTWSAMLTRTCVLQIWRMSGEPDFGLDGFDTAFAAWLVISGGVFHLAASTIGAEEVKELPSMGAKLLRRAAAGGLSLGLGLAAARWAWT